MAFHEGWFDLGISGTTWSPLNKIPDFPRGQLNGKNAWQQGRGRNGEYVFRLQFAQGLVVLVNYLPHHPTEDGYWGLTIDWLPSDFGRGLGYPLYLVPGKQGKPYDLVQEASEAERMLPIDQDSVPETLRLIAQGIHAAWAMFLPELVADKDALQKHLAEETWPGAELTPEQQKEQEAKQEEQRKQAQAPKYSSPFAGVLIGDNIKQLYFDAIVVHAAEENKTLPFYGDPYGPFVTMRVYSGPKDIQKNVLERVTTLGAPGVDEAEIEKAKSTLANRSQVVRVALVYLRSKQNAEVLLFDNYAKAHNAFTVACRELIRTRGKRTYSYIKPAPPTSQTAHASSLLALGSALASSQT